MCEVVSDGRRTNTLKEAHIHVYMNLEILMVETYNKKCEKGIFFLHKSHYLPLPSVKQCANKNVTEGDQSGNLKTPVICYRTYIRR